MRHDVSDQAHLLSRSYGREQLHGSYGLNRSARFGAGLIEGIDHGAKGIPKVEIDPGRVVFDVVGRMEVTACEV